MMFAGLFRGSLVSLVLLGGVVAGCARTEIIESPRTGFASDAGEPKDPAVIWTSRTLSDEFDYLGVVKARSWTYDGALDRLIAAGKDMHADAITDIHYERVGFMKTMQAFAIKFK